MDSNHSIKSPTKRESLIIRFMILVGVLSIFNFLYFFFNPDFRGYLPLYLLLSTILIYGALKKLYLWYHYFTISVPETPALTQNLKVDVLTTYFPGEPYEMIVGTLEAIQEITYPHTTYLCDEANDLYLKKECKRLGVIHVTRDNRIDAKAGNINNALKQATGEICLVLDPDHVPEPDFLDVVLPHFNDDEIGFVQVVQAYYNKYDSLVARGAAEQTFQFYGPMMMCMNSYGTVNAIGANCTFRRAALDSIGGHAPGLAEDMHTAMLLHGQGWKSVYVPELVAKGLAPPDLVSYFKQQLKWSRGTFELLYSVYPKQFKNFTSRQRIHYALLPLHYLIGFVYLISFLIPIISLVLSKMPWTGDILNFAVVSFPVLMSSLLIRTYIQKWVIEKYDRGFHIIGGLLQIVTWWIFILGVTYTFIRKKVPYLPTPKSEEGTHLGITIPNLVIAGASIFAIIYGLAQDLTPFSLIMAFFALLNALFMLYSIYLAFQVTNRNRILRSTLRHRTIEGLKKIKKVFIAIADKSFVIIRNLALPLLILSLLASGVGFDFLQKEKWNPSRNINNMKDDKHYLGIFYPSEPSGISDLTRVRQFEKREDIDFQIVSFYLAWGDSAAHRISPGYLKKINNMRASPLITWEPWAAGFQNNDSLMDLSEKRGIYKMITEGYFDEYIRSTASAVKNFKNKVFLRFAHEFDNPFYPWSLNGANTPADFIKAWRYVHNRFGEAEVANVEWVWSPWKADVPPTTYPGDEYVDWLGVTLLDYSGINSDDVWYPFTALYKPFHDTFKKFSGKPVMLAEFGSLGLSGNREEWVTESFNAINSEYKEIKAVVFFNSRYDKNIPETRSDFQGNYLDWGIDHLLATDKPFFRPYEPYTGTEPTVVNIIKTEKKYKGLPLDPSIRGVNYKKADHWLDNNYIVDKDVLIRDFEMMKNIGINTIKFRHSNIYGHNVLKYSKECGMDILYSFPFPKDIDFIHDKEEVAEFQRSILEQVKKLKDESRIVGWYLENDPWVEWDALDTSTAIDSERDVVNRSNRNMADRHRKYVLWWKKLASEIKEVDSERPLLKEVKLSQKPEMQVAEIVQAGIAIDGFGIYLDDIAHAQESLNFMDTNAIPYIVSGVGVKELKNWKVEIDDKAIIVQNWQNQWETGKITLDGLLDFKGRKKLEYGLLKEFWGDTEKKSDVDVDMGAILPVVKILRSAIPLITDDEVTFDAMLFKEHAWYRPKADEPLRLEWHLAHYDTYGNIVAIKKLADGPTAKLNVPPNYDEFRIILTVAKDGFSNTLKTTLNTPL